MGRSVDMRRFVAVLLVGLGVIAWAKPAFAKIETVTGEVISISCYLENKTNIGQKGWVCANATVKWEGQPVGLLTRDGKLYQLEGDLVANNNAKIVPYLTQTVTITGDVTEKNGMTMLAGTDVKTVK
jgi:hypothetical protein